MASCQLLQGIDIFLWGTRTMSETDFLESAVSEYRPLLEPAWDKDVGRVNTERLINQLALEHDWTDLGARAIVSLATGYGAFILRNALALAIILDKEDGDFGF
jgi:hypothetical protein